LGAPDEATDTLYEQAILHFLSQGGNCIDTAINYRWQASERMIGKALAKAFAAGIPRESLFISTKGGFIPGDSHGGLDADAYWNTQLVETGIVTADDIVEGCHCIAPAYLRHQVAQSCKNLGLETIDLYYLHNPETQLEEVSHTVFMQRITAAFEVLEALVAEGKIRNYGCATWNGLRTPTTEKVRMDLESLVEAAHNVGGANHHFRAVQAPFNLAMPEVMMARTQVVKGEKLPLLQAAERLGIAVICSAPLMQSQLLRRLPAKVGDAFSGYDTAAARLLAFVINAPGVLAAMCGMKQLAHVDANWDATMHPHLTADEWLSCIRKLQ
jgi:aryl-alcohol dehydrogenase-like predicted oxidoreductase